MFKTIFGRFYWTIIRRNLLKFQVKGFVSSLFSYASKDCNFSAYNKLCAFSKLYNTKLGRFSYVNKHTVISNTEIGAFCSIGSGVKIGGFGRHPTGWITTHPAFFSTRGQIKISFQNQDHFTELLPVKVGNDVWIGDRAIVLDGVSIGDGAIIAAGCVVTKDVEPYAIIGGVPGKLIRFRFSKMEIEALQSSSWWSENIDFFRNKAYLFRSNKVSQFIDELNKTRTGNLS